MHVPLSRKKKTNAKGSQTTFALLEKKNKQKNVYKVLNPVKLVNNNA